MQSELGGNSKRTSFQLDFVPSTSCRLSRLGTTQSRPLSKTLASDVSQVCDESLKLPPEKSVSLMPLTIFFLAVCSLQLIFPSVSQGFLETLTCAKMVSTLSDKATWYHSSAEDFKQRSIHNQIPHRLVQLTRDQQPETAFE